MSVNTSWLKKPNSMVSRRTMILQNVTSESNSTLTMAATESENIFRPPKRKSCMMNKDRPLMKMPEVPKGRQSMAPKGQFKNRTIKMMESTRSMLPVVKPAILRVAIGRRAPQMRSTPLHMSTPCEPPRSILKGDNKCNNPPSIILAKPRSAAKKVNFDALDGVCALDESTIANFELPPVAPMPLVVAKIDASTNTEEQENHETVSKTSEKISIENNEMFKIILEQMQELRELVSKNNCNKCNCLPQNGPTSILSSNFITRLDAIKEDSENVTPSSVENSTPLLALTNSSATAANTPVSGTSASTQTVQLLQFEEHLTPPEEENQGSAVTTTVADTDYTTEDQQASPQTETEPVSDDFEEVRRSTRQNPTLASPALRMVRKPRKRSVPKYLQNFDIALSPKLAKIRH